ncbi:hypothetical protein B0H12DRAFT_1123006 [Mycena haematopus]|nr:hypothetical protein B0H12DRAFT_1123006 [Mycena haematopus]
MKLLMAWSCVVAAGATTQMAFTIFQAVETAHSVEHLLHAQESNPPVLAVLNTAQYVLMATNNFMTDSLYLYRCYVIWGCRWKILILPGLFMLSTFVLTVLSVASIGRIVDAQFVYSLMMTTNLILTALTAGRLLWIRRTTSCVIVENMFRARCNRAIGMILESGAIYCIVMIVLLITVSRDAPGVYTQLYSIELGFLSQLYNIIPTFTLVYVGLNEIKPQGTEKKGGEYA